MRKDLIYLLIGLFLISIASAFNPAWNGIVTYYSFDNNISAVYPDLVLGVNNATNTDAVNVSGILKSAVNTSTGKYLTALDSPSLSITGALTVNFWIKSDTTSGAVVAKQAGGFSGEFSTLRGAGSITFYRGNNVNSEDSLAVAMPNNAVTWQMVTLVCNSSFNCSAYVNGTLIVTKIMSYTVADTTANLLMGKRGDGQPYTGSLDEVGIWNRSLNITEIGYLYNNGLGNTLNLSAENTPAGSYLYNGTFTSPLTGNYKDSIQINYTACNSSPNPITQYVLYYVLPNGTAIFLKDNGVSLSYNWVNASNYSITNLRLNVTCSDSFAFNSTISGYFNVTPTLYLYNGTIVSPNQVAYNDSLLINWTNCTSNLPVDYYQTNFTDSLGASHIIVNNSISAINWSTSSNLTNIRIDVGCFAGSMSNRTSSGLFNFSTTAAGHAASNLTFTYFDITAQCVLDQSLSYVFGYMMLLFLIVIVFLCSIIWIKIPILNILLGLALIIATLNLYACTWMIGACFTFFGLAIIIYDVWYIFAGKVFS